MKLKTPFFLHSCLILLSGVICGVLLTFFVIKPDEWWRNVLTSFAQQEQKFTKFTLIDQLLADEYWDKDNLASAQPRMIDNALRSYVAGIDDPYTNYLTAEENTQLVQSLHEETGIEGIGAVIEKRDNYIQIAEIIKHGPAYKAGLLPLDRIFFIETGSTQDLNVNEAVAQIRGEKGTEVRLFIQRVEKAGTTKEFWISITRDHIELPSVVATLLEEKGKKIGLFEISSISEHTTKLFINELTAFIQQGMKGMILDLRGNGGGYLEEAATLLGHFVPKDESVVKSEYQAYQSVDFLSKGRGELANIPTVILIDQLTASAGEIIALTLQERGVPIIGMPSFGKGSIQTFSEFSDGSSLKYTIGKWYSPRHISVDGTGVVPNIEVKREYEAYQASGIDNQLEEGKKVLGELLVRDEK